MIFEMNEVTIKDVLEFLDESGWSELIDSRWERELTKEIYNKFPNISEEVLDKTLKIVIW
jgi:hypothetical protein